MTNRILSLILLSWFLSLDVIGQIPEGFVFIKGARYEGGRIHVEDLLHVQFVAFGVGQGQRRGYQEFLAGGVRIDVEL